MIDLTRVFERNDKPIVGLLTHRVVPSSLARRFRRFVRTVLGDAPFNTERGWHAERAVVRELELLARL
jgi:hypothetical protein